jgi:hypothetical protein
MRMLLVSATLVALAAPARADDDFAAMKKERVGGLAIGTPAAAALKLLGPPAKKGKVVHQESDGNYVQTWSFAQGVELVMSASKRGGAQTVDAITVQAPSALKTARGIGVGSSVAELERAYGAEKNAEETNAESFVVGSIYGGVIFRLAEKKVSQIFVGAAAE